MRFNPARDPRSRYRHTVAEEPQLDAHRMERSYRALPCHRAETSYHDWSRKPVDYKASNVTVAVLCNKARQETLALAKQIAEVIGGEYEHELAFSELLNKVFSPAYEDDIKRPPVYFPEPCDPDDPVCMATEGELDYEMHDLAEMAELAAEAEREAK